MTRRHAAWTAVKTAYGLLCAWALIVYLSPLREVPQPWRAVLVLLGLLLAPMAGGVIFHATAPGGASTPTKGGTTCSVH